MARKYEYPENRSLLARVQCVMGALAAARHALSNVEEFVLPRIEVTSVFKQTITEQVQEALTLLRTAGQAMSGEDES